MRDWPQVLVVFDCVAMFALSCLLHGRSRGPHSPLLKAFDIAIIVAVLGCGGFFAVWGWRP